MKLLFQQIDLVSFLLFAQYKNCELCCWMVVFPYFQSISIAFNMLSKQCTCEQKWKSNVKKKTYINMSCFVYSHKWQTKTKKKSNRNHRITMLKAILCSTIFFKWQTVQTVWHLEWNVCYYEPCQVQFYYDYEKEKENPNVHFVKYSLKMLNIEKLYNAMCTECKFNCLCRLSCSV